MSFARVVGGYSGGYDPSNAPPPSMITAASSAQPSVAGSHAGGWTPGPMFDNPYYVKVWRTRTSFKRGDIISRPHHTPDNGRKINPHDRNLKETVAGYVYSKRRMLVVLWIYHDCMFCVPLYSHGGNGITHKTRLQQREYMALTNVPGEVKAAKFQRGSELLATFKEPIRPNTFVAVTAGTKVACNEVIKKVGEMEEKSYNRLVSQWHQLKDEAWEDPAGQPVSKSK